MKNFFTYLGVGALALVVVALLVLVISLVFIGVGWVLTRFVDLSLFQAAVIALLAGVGLFYVAGRVVAFLTEVSRIPEEEEDWEDEEEDYEPSIRYMGKAGSRIILEEEPPPVKPNDPCPCGSGRKYRYCCGKKKS